jgi:hypothetical protein
MTMPRSLFLQATRPVTVRDCSKSLDRDGGNLRCR